MLFRKKIERSCAYCANGARLGGGQILCAKKGLKTVDDQCRKFKYDPCPRPWIFPSMTMRTFLCNEAY